MHNPLVNETLFRTGAGVIEALGMMFLVQEDEATPLPDDEKMTVEVAFSGPFDGTLVVAASERILPTLASNMLGMPDDAAPSREQQEDALKELGNVICGNLLPAIAGTESVFHIAAPVVIRKTLETNENPPVGTALLNVDAGIVALALRTASASVMAGVA